MNTKDDIKEFFLKNLGNKEASVNPELWNAISSSLPVVKAAKTSFILSNKLILVTSIISGLSVVSLLIYYNKFSETKKVVSSNTIKKQINISPEKESTTTKNVFISKVNIDNEKIILQDDIVTELIVEDEVHYINEDKEENFVSESEINKDPEILNQVAQQNIVEKNKNEIENQNDVNITKKVIQFSLPNIFTPNNDGVNDLFYLDVSFLTDFSISVIDQNNKLVFNSENKFFKWDGKDFNNNLVSPGTYIYYFSGKDENGEIVSKYAKLELKY